MGGASSNPQRLSKQNENRELTSILNNKYGNLPSRYVKEGKLNISTKSAREG